MAKGTVERIPNSFIEMTPKPSKAFLRENGIIPQKKRAGRRKKKKCKNKK